MVTKKKSCSARCCPVFRQFPVYSRCWTGKSARASHRTGQQRASPQSGGHHQGLEDHRLFFHSHFGDGVRARQTGSLPYQTALEILGLAPEEAVAFEDGPTGIRASVAASISTVGLTTTQTASTLVEAGVSLSFAISPIRSYGLTWRPVLPVPLSYGRRIFNEHLNRRISLPMIDPQGSRQSQRRSIVSEQRRS